MSFRAPLLTWAMTVFPATSEAETFQPRAIVKKAPRTSVLGGYARINLEERGHRPRTSTSTNAHHRPEEEASQRLGGRCTAMTALWRSRWTTSNGAAGRTPHVWSWRWKPWTVAEVPDVTAALPKPHRLLVLMTEGSLVCTRQEQKEVQRHKAALGQPVVGPTAGDAGGDNLAPPGAGVTNLEGYTVTDKSRWRTHLIRLCTRDATSLTTFSASSAWLPGRTGA
jgi:hypothetical protein